MVYGVSVQKRTHIKRESFCNVKCDCTIAPTFIGLWPLKHFFIGQLYYTASSSYNVIEEGRCLHFSKAGHALCEQCILYTVLVKSSTLQTLNHTMGVISKS